MQSNKLWFDIEADNFLYDATIIWCIVGYDSNTYHIYHIEDGLEYKYPSNSTIYKDLNEYKQYLSTKILVGHNIIPYDLPLLNKLGGFTYEINPNTIVDTHILSRLYNPDRLGHSLEWWGERLRFKKGNHNDWTKFSQEMLSYCIQDVNVTRRVDMALQDEAGDWDWSESIKLEYHIWDIQMRQEQRGVAFDSNAALVLLDKVVKEIEEIETEIIPKIPMRLEDDGEVKKIFNKDGTYTKSVLTWLGDVT